MDAHHHLWHPSAHPQEWLAGLPALNRPYTIRDLHLATLPTPVRRTVLAQASPSEEETRQLLALDHPLVAGVVGWTDITSPAIEENLAALRHPKLAGIRHGAQSEPDPRWLCRPEVIRGLKAVAAAGLPFDLLVRAHQLPAAVEAVRAVPELTFVLDHLGKPPIGTQSSWDIRALAESPNVVAKLSGLPTEAHWSTWTVTDLRPYVEEALTTFGPARLMWGSDWPVCLLAATYAQVHSTADLLTAHLTATEREAIFTTTATRIYKLSTTH